MVRLFVHLRYTQDVIANALSGTPRPPHLLNSHRISPRQTLFLMMKRPMVPMNPRKKGLKLWKLVRLEPKAKTLRWTVLRSLLLQKRKWTTMMLRARLADSFRLLCIETFQKVDANLRLGS